jgi:hypothetical protein
LVPSIAAVVISKKRRLIISAFQDAGATSPENAKLLEDIGLSKGVLLDVQKLRGVLVEVAPNCFYLDEEREREAARFRRMLVVVLLALVVVIIWFINR